MADNRHDNGSLPVDQTDYRSERQGANIGQKPRYVDLLLGRLGDLFGPQPGELAAVGDPGAPAGTIPSPRTPTGVIYAHAGQEELQPTPGPTREIEGRLADLPRGMRADVPTTYHILHHITETVEAGRPWWAVVRFTIPTTNPILIAPANPKRAILTIVNQDSTNPVDIGPDPSLTLAGPTSFRIPFGATLDLRHTREIWAIASTSPVAVCIRSEFTERPSGSGGGEQ